MISFHAWIHSSSYQIPLYLRNIAVFDVMKYWYSRGIRQVFDDKNDQLSILHKLENWYLNFLSIKYWYLTNGVRV
ncbi:MAG: hypothetical protein ACHQUC_04450 [Chlamydiales bacterium]